LGRYYENDRDIKYFCYRRGTAGICKGLCPFIETADTLDQCNISVTTAEMKNVLYLCSESVKVSRVRQGCPEAADR
jgi:hypothetical protein